METLQNHSAFFQQILLGFHLVNIKSMKFKVLTLASKEEGCIYYCFVFQTITFIYTKIRSQLT